MTNVRVTRETSITDASAFMPVWRSAPGDTIAGLVDDRGLSQRDLAGRTGFTLEQIANLVRGESAITHQLAQQLSIVLGSTNEFWHARTATYRAGMQRRHLSESQRGETNS